MTRFTSFPCPFSLFFLGKLPATSTVSQRTEPRNRFQTFTRHRILSMGHFCQITSDQLSEMSTLYGGGIDVLRRRVKTVIEKWRFAEAGRCRLKETGGATWRGCG
jgi:hypothetical protein